MKILRTVAELRANSSDIRTIIGSVWCRRWARCMTAMSRCYGRRATLRARRRVDLRQPGTVQRPCRSRGISAAGGPRCRNCESGRGRFPVRSISRGNVSARRRDVARRARCGARVRRRIQAGSLQQRRHHLPQAVQHRRARRRVLRPEGCAAGRRHPADGS